MAKRTKINHNKVANTEGSFAYDSDDSFQTGILICEYSPNNCIYDPTASISDIYKAFSGFFNADLGVLRRNVDQLEEEKNQKYKRNFKCANKGVLKQENVFKKDVLVLDIDNALVRTTDTYYSHPDDKFEPVTKANFGKRSYYYKFQRWDGEELEFITRPRTYLKQFLLKAAELFDIALFTNSSSDYANIMAEYFSVVVPIRHVLTRENLQFNGAPPAKDLQCFAEFYENYYLVDNACFAFLLQMDRGIYIEHYEGREDDVELKKLTGMLDDLHKDGKEFLKERIRLKELVDYHRKLLYKN